MPSVFLVEDRIKGSFSPEISWLHLIMQSSHRCESDLPRNLMLLFPQKNAGFLDTGLPLWHCWKKPKNIPQLAGRAVHCQAGLLERHKSDHYKSQSEKWAEPCGLKEEQQSQPLSWNWAGLWCCSGNEWKRRAFLSSSKCSSQELCEKSTGRCDPAQLVPGNATGAAASPEQPNPTCLLCFWLLLPAPTPPCPCPRSCQCNPGTHPSVFVPVLHASVGERRCPAVSQPQGMQGCDSSRTGAQPQPNEASQPRRRKKTHKTLI